MTSFDFMTDVDVVEKPLIKKRARIWELDFLRGFLILLMILDHLFMTVDYFFGPVWMNLSNGATNGFTKFYNASAYYIGHPAREVIHPIVVLTFITLCGLSTGFSRNNLKRACTLALISIGITTVTAVAETYEPGFIIRFGIIHLLATCVATWAVVELITRHNKRLNFLLGITLGLIIAGLSMKATFDLDFQSKVASDAFVFVFTDGTFAMSPGDFWPIFPYAGIFFFASAVSPYLYADKKSLLSKLDGKWNKPLCFIGRNTLFVYVVHLIFIVAILEVASYLGFHQWLIDIF